MQRFDLVGVDGNAFNIMGYVVNAMRNTGFTKEQIKDYQDEAMSSDYDNLLAVSVQRIDDCNEKLEASGELEDE